MYPYIVCRCGRSLGDIYDLFCYLRQERYLEELDKIFATNKLVIDPAFLPFTDFAQIKLDDIFDDLCLDMLCCRAIINTQVEFKAVY
jgi:DNA-directed RNA polymerase subunit N (RpoN/RPB10)